MSTRATSGGGGGEGGGGGRRGGGGGGGRGGRRGGGGSRGAGVGAGRGGERGAPDAREGGGMGETLGPEGEAGGGRRGKPRPPRAGAGLTRPGRPRPRRGHRPGPPAPRSTTPRPACRPGGRASPARAEASRRSGSAGAARTAPRGTASRPGEVMDRFVAGPADQLGRVVVAEDFQGGRVEEDEASRRIGDVERVRGRRDGLEDGCRRGGRHGFGDHVRIVIRWQPGVPPG